MLRYVCVMALTGAGAGCGLVDSDIADFSLRLPEKEVTIDTAQWMLPDESRMPDVPCAGMMTICDTTVSEICAAGDETCESRCDGQSCDLTVTVALWNEFDLSSEVPELMDIDEQPLATVGVDRIYYSVNENTLNVDSPRLRVYVAPQGVMTPDNSRAQELGAIEPIPPGTTIGEADVLLSDEGRDLLRDYIKAYATPFNIIVATEIGLEAGDPVPTGRLVAVIKVDAHASPGL